MVKLTLCLLELSANESVHLGVIVIMELLGIDSPPVNSLTDLHDGSEAHLPLHLLLGDASAEGPA